MAIVYLAEHNTLKKKFAVKVLSDVLSNQASVRERFLQEARVLASLDHPGIVRVTDVIEAGSRIAIVMDYIEGNTLDHLIGTQVGPIPWRGALKLFQQILDAVKYAHSKGVIHRDLKPANIMVTPEGKTLIMDFGIAKITGSNVMTRTGARLGSPFYMSPEQVQGLKTIDQRTDVYSLGITLYEMLAGRLPFNHEEDTSEFQIMTKIVNGNIPDPRTFYPHIPDKLVECITDATESDVHQRISSCSVFEQVIRYVQENETDDLIERYKNETCSNNIMDAAVTDTEFDQNPSDHYRESDEIRSKKTANSYHTNRRTWIRKIPIMFILLFAGAGTGTGLYYLFFQKHFQYRTALEMAEGGAYLAALQQLNALGDYSDAEQQGYRITRQLMSDYFETEQYYNLAKLLSVLDSNFVDELFRDLGVTTYKIYRLVQVVNQYGLELNHIGKLSLANFPQGVTVIAGTLQVPPEQRLKPKVIVTRHDTFIGTISGTLHVGFNYHDSLSTGVELTIPRDSLIARISEVQSVLSEAYPDLRLTNAGILVDETVPYETTVEVLEILINAGYSEVEVQVGPSSIFSNVLSYEDMLDFQSAAGAGQGLASAQTEQSLNSCAAIGGGLASRAASGGGVQTLDTLECVSFTAVQTAHSAAQVSFSASASGEAIDLGYRNMSDIRRRINVIKMRVQTAYESLLQTNPGASGTITINFSITPGGSVTGVSVSCPSSLSSLQGTINTAISSLNFGPASEQTQNLPVSVPFMLTPPD